MIKKILTNHYSQLIRLDKPIGTLLLFLPCLFGLVLVVQKFNFQSFYLLFLFFCGSFFMRSAGCIINDICDKDFDKQVKRTKERPIASGKISVKQALILLIFLLFFSLIILLQLNWQSIVLGFLSLLLVTLYPLMKRFTFYPQVFLGLTFNLGILFASTSVLEKISFPSLILYVASIFWTIIYDSIYGYQDLQDDLKIGVKSSSIKFGTKPQKILYSLSTIYFSLMIFLGIISDFTIAYFSLILLASSCLICQIKTCDFLNPADCLKKFKSNFWMGIIVVLAIILGKS